MAPPRHRDRGFSRRIQYGLFFGYVAATAGIVAAIALILIARFQPLAFEGIRGLALDATAPFTTATRPIVRGATSLGGDIADYFGAASENKALRARLAAAERQVIQARATAAENVRLQRLLRFSGEASQPVASARIVGSNVTGNRRFATLVAGSADGVRSGQPVRGPEGLVGRIAEVGRHAARIVLLTDGSSAVPLRVVRTGAPVLGQGRGDGAIDVRATIAGAPGLRRGDLLVTSGLGGVYPPGLPVAVVTGTSGELATALPLANPAKLDLAVVLTEVPPPPPPAPIDGPR
ncbi:rod shape-determining protein MreC [uncultured Sphingomonas sp.]|uniref:rod shape-determining protein MreC n=1 Tax=uncultured Sphingomonas sp. TaxID=158754 RepID=UPI0025F674D9|nr:rod shape-determining protein MreC [uncultured Sphingomonas sp.]